MPGPFADAFTNCPHPERTPSMQDAFSRLSGGRPSGTDSHLQAWASASATRGARLQVPVMQLVAGKPTFHLPCWLMPQIRESQSGSGLRVPRQIGAPSRAYPLQCCGLRGQAVPRWIRVRAEQRHRQPRDSVVYPLLPCTRCLKRAYRFAAERWCWPAAVPSERRRPFQTTPSSAPTPPPHPGSRAPETSPLRVWPFPAGCRGCSG